MRYAVEIDLDYGLMPQDEVHRVWRLLRGALLEADFRADGRRFTSNREPEQAARTAYGVMETVERRLRTEGGNLHRYVRSYYGYPLACADNLLLPPAETIKVRSGLA